jgi:hypothetical protein
MLEYVFFDDEPRQRFLAFLEQHGVSWTLESALPETLVVIDDTQLDEELADSLESLYDELFALEQSLFAAQKAQSEAPRKSTGVLLHLKDGTELHADLSPELINRVLTAISSEELDLIADAIVCAFEDSERQAPD